MAYRTILLFGAPGSGKGTQGKILGSIPGFFHCACGDVFRSLDLKTEIGQAFLAYSSRGELVPDEFTIKLWKHSIGELEAAHRFRPESDVLVLDGIPRNVAQAEMLAGTLDVLRVVHLSCEDLGKMTERLRRRALKENRLDDARDDVIRRRLDVYEAETRPVLEYYPKDKIIQVDATLTQTDVLVSILTAIRPVMA
jgi:adenylate kinase